MHLQDTCSRRTQAEEYLEDGIPDETAARAQGRRGRAGRRARCRRRGSCCIRRPPHDQQVRLLRLPRHSRLRGRQADRHRPGRLGPQGRRKLAFEQIASTSKHGHGQAGRRAATAAGRNDERTPADRRRSRHDTPRSIPTTSTTTRLLHAEADRPRARTASSGRSCASRGATTTRRPRTRATTNGCGCRSSRSSTTQREAVITFVLGLVAEPPASQYVYTPTRGSRRSSKGSQVLEKYNCGGCHTLEMETWEIRRIDPEEFADPPAVRPTIPS